MYHRLKDSYSTHMAACINWGLQTRPSFPYPGIGFANDRRTCDVTGLTAVKPVTSPAYSLLPNCFSCARASSAACSTPTIRNWTPESDCKHKKTSSINCKLQTKADWKSIFPVSYSYRHQSSLITYMEKLQQSVTQSAWKSLSLFSSKISSQKKFH